MGTITDRNKNELEISDHYEDTDLQDMLDWTLPEKLDELFRKKGISGSKVSKISGISKSYINDLRHPSEKMIRPQRNKIINICLAAGATLEELNDILKNGRMQELYSRDHADSIIIWGLLHNLDYNAIWDMLDENGYANILGDDSAS